MHNRTFLFSSALLAIGVIRGGIEGRPALKWRADDIAAPAESTVTISVGTRIAATLAQSLAIGSVRVGGSVYVRTATSIVANRQLAIPAGSLIEAKVEAIGTGDLRERRLDVELRLMRLIYPGSGLVDLGVPNDSGGASVASAMAVVAASRRSGEAEIGDAIELVVTSAFSVDAHRVRAYVSTEREGYAHEASRAPDQCLGPSTPGTPQIVVPGSPGSPPIGELPGSPATPDIVIPGTPDLPGRWESCGGTAVPRPRR
jgi:hypothetical protein